MSTIPSTENVQAHAYRTAPPGFTQARWEQFMRDGFLVIENALSPAEIDRYIDGKPANSAAANTSARRTSSNATRCSPS